MPIWVGGYILLPVLHKHFDWIAYSQHGELALYSAAFLAPTLRLIGRDVEGSQFVRRQSFLFLGWISLTAAVALYSTVISAAEFPRDVVSVNANLVFVFSLLLFIFSVIFSSLVRLIDYQRIPPKEFFRLQNASAKRLSTEFDAMGPAPMTPEVDTQTAANSESTDEGAADPSETVGDTEDKLSKDFDAESGADDGIDEHKN